MKFLSQVASAFYKIEGQKLKEYCFVFPNRRAGLFFQKYVGEIATEPLFSPAIMTINDMFTLLSGLKQVDRLEAIFKLYGLYLEISGSQESFDEFIFWGDIILSDFNDVDKYLADTKKLFANIKDIKEIESDYSFLSPKQLEAVQTFWSNFLPVGDSEKKTQFRAIWVTLYPLYLRFKSELEAKGLGYEGMIYRKIAEEILGKGEGAENLIGKFSEYRKVVFVGFNALTSCEKVLLKALKNAGIADFYWDFNGDLIRNKDNKASLFMMENIALFPSSLDLNFDTDSKQKIEVIGIPSAVGEAKMVSKIIKEIGGGINTAIVLPDETLLMPILYSIPQEVESVNVTMGYPLKSSSIVSLMESIMELQKGSFYYKKVLAVLKHHYIKMVVKEDALTLIDRIAERNMVFVEEKEFNNHSLLKLIFRHTVQVSDYLLEILEYLNNSVDLTRIEKEFIYFLYTEVSRIRDLMIPMSIDTYCRVLMQIVNSSSIPFRGEPLQGLQIMGVLETRTLDFDNIIICSMNDGTFPSRSPVNSFIPYNLRKGFSMPDFEFMDGMAAYHFYRLIYRAKKVFLLYDTRSEGLRNGEVSRFIHQLKYHFKVPLKESIVTFTVGSNKKDPVIIDKSEDIIRRIGKLFLKDGEKSFSASSINTYIDCPLKFYLQHVKNIAEEESVVESVEADTFGSIFHSSMEFLYKGFIGKLVTKELLYDLLKQNENIENITREAFINILKIKEIKGHNLLIQKLIIRYIQQTIRYDVSKCPFEYIGSETRLNMDFKLDNGMIVGIKGFIDRLDKIDGVQRIVDYKTGSGWEKFNNCQELFDCTNKKRNKIALQLILYVLMTDSKDKMIISPYMLRKLFKEKNPEMTIEKELLDQFSISLKDTLLKIVDSTTPFVQTQNENICKYCPYSVICK